MKKYLLFVLLLMNLQYVEARPPKGHKKHPAHVTYRADCQPGTSKYGLNVNNVRVRLQSRGDMWWDNSSIGYVVPNSPVGGGVEQVSSLYSGATWIGGYDASGNLKLAATDYLGVTYYPGPLNESTGTTSQAVCNAWDRHFVVYGTEITLFVAKWDLAHQNGMPIDESEIPDNVKYYPARGNPYFATTASGFILPDQDLAPFFDRNNDGVYNPIDGDYPILEIRSSANPGYADMMIYSISNDVGKEQLVAQGNSLGIELQTQSFAFATSDALNDMTFSSQKIINRSMDTLHEAIISIWIDGDLGCGNDDYVGCDTTRSLVYYYNADAVDGAPDGSCAGTPTYGNKIPLIGIDIFCSPLGDDGKPLKMSSFIYYNNSSSSSVPLGTTDPSSGTEYFNYMRGLWKDGSPMYAGADGYQDSQFATTKYAFPDSPKDELGWSMAQAEVDFADRRTVQSLESFTMSPGSISELVIGFPWVANVLHPAPSLEALLAADDLVQAIFDGCFTNVVGSNFANSIELSVYPNPATDYIHIQSSKTLQTVNFQLTNMAGQVVLSQKITPNDEISIRHLPQGVYGYQMKDLKGVILSVGELIKD